MTGKNTITLSDHLGVPPERLQDAGILNVVLGIDTHLFIDPKLIGNSAVPELATAEQEIHDYFNTFMDVLRQAPKADRLMEIATSKIAIEEPKGLSLGYGSSRDSGTSISERVARDSIRSLNEMISVGVEDLKVMELLGLFIKGFGADSISDLIAHIIYARFCEYTQRICKELGVDTTKYTIEDSDYQLPKHPFKNHQLIFVPLDVLRELPLATSWDEISQAAQLNAACRRSFNRLVGQDIARFAKGVRDNPQPVFSTLANVNILLEVYEEATVKPYNLGVDSKGYDRLGRYISENVSSLPVPEPKIINVQEMVEFIRNNVIEQYRRSIEDLGANRLLYHRDGEAVNPNKPIHEEAAQILFHTSADHLCKSSDILLIRESKTGPGSVDFVMGAGHSTKVLVEIKKSTNKSLLDGYDQQLKRYVKSEDAADAFYVVVTVRQANVTNRESQLNELKRQYAAKIEAKEPCPHLVVINGLIGPTASQLKN